MYIRNCTSSLIFFALLGQKIGDACLPVGKTETPKYQFGTNYILIFFAYRQSHIIIFSIILSLKPFPETCLPRR